MTKTCVLVLGGEIRDIESFACCVQKADYIMAADGGVRHLLSINVTPHRLMGDLDSITKEDLAFLESCPCQIDIVPQEKDDTDGMLILREAIASGYENIEIWGALGGRPDHSFANIMLLLTARKLFQKGQANKQGQEPFVYLSDGGVRIFLASKGQIIQGSPGDLVSLFALGEEVTGFESQGLKYQPPGGRYNMADPALGTSNEMTKDQARLTWEKGTLLCMHIYDN